MIRKFQRKFLVPLLDLLFPPRCGNCDVLLNVNERGLCMSCLDTVRFLRPPLCHRCGEAFVGGTEAGHICGNCLQFDPHFRFARSLVHYGPVSGNLLRRLKYHGDMGVAGAIDRIVALAEWPLIGRFDLIVPVPLAQCRLRQRGFNQSVFLARLLFADMQRKIAADLLYKKRETPSQTGQGRKARHKNVRGAFGVRDTVSLANRRICLIDDVFTTGATVSECSRTLLQAGAEEVCVITLARTARR